MRADGDGALALQNEIDLFAGPVVVGPGGCPGGEGGLGEALVLDGGVGPVEDAADRGAIFGCERGLAD